MTFTVFFKGFLIVLCVFVGLVVLGSYLWALGNTRAEERAQKNAEKNGFKILVPKKERGEEFKFSDLMKEAEIFHGGCYKGKAELRQERGECAPYWRLICWRCQLTEVFGTPGSFEGTSEIVAATERVIKTAIDGKTRRLGTTLPGTVLCVAQKNSRE